MHAVLHQRMRRDQTTQLRTIYSIEGYVTLPARTLRYTHESHTGYTHGSQRTARNARLAHHTVITHSSQRTAVKTIG